MTSNARTSDGPATTAVLSARALHKTYRRGLLRKPQQVLRGVDLDLHPGQVVGATGENGSGKSTLMKLLVGALRPDSGTVTHTGRIRQAMTAMAASDGSSRAGSIEGRGRP